MFSSTNSFKIVHSLNIGLCDIKENEHDLSRHVVASRFSVFFSTLTLFDQKLPVKPELYP
jgi:hypothetical protein